jgi:hypothetical protein
MGNLDKVLLNVGHKMLDSVTIVVGMPGFMLWNDFGESHAEKIDSPNAGYGSGVVEVEHIFIGPHNLTDGPIAGVWLLKEKDLLIGGVVDNGKTDCADLYGSAPTRRCELGLKGGLLLKGELNDQANFSGEEIDSNPSVLSIDKAINRSISHPNVAAVVEVVAASPVVGHPALQDNRAVVFDNVDVDLIGLEDGAKKYKQGTTLMLKHPDLIESFVRIWGSVDLNTIPGFIRSLQGKKSILSYQIGIILRV